MRRVHLDVMMKSAIRRRAGAFEERLGATTSFFRAFDRSSSTDDAQCLVMLDFIPVAPFDLS